MSCPYCVSGKLKKSYGRVYVCKTCGRAVHIHPPLEYIHDPKRPYPDIKPE